MSSETLQGPKDSEGSQDLEHSMAHHHSRRARPYVMAITLLLSAGLLTFGLIQIGHGIAAKGADIITVTGSARVSVSADNAAWLLSIQESRNSAATAIAKAESGAKSILTILQNKEFLQARLKSAASIYVADARVLQWKSHWKSSFVSSKPRCNSSI